MRKRRQPLYRQRKKKTSRTLTFGNWPFGTDSITIKAFIDEYMKDYAGGLEGGGAFAFGKHTAKRGAARFKTQALLLRFTRRSEMEWKF